MVTDETYEDALAIVSDMLDDLGDLEKSKEGYIDLMEFALEEIKVSLMAAQSDLG